MGRLVVGVETLEVYQLAFELQQRIFEITRTFPHEETYSLTDQIRRSSRSVGANLREAWAKRYYVAHFRSKLTDSMGEASETCHWVATAHSCGYISSEVSDDLTTKYHRVGAMLNKMIGQAESWCRQRG